jgi:uncharacterized protein YcfL
MITVKNDVITSKYERYRMVSALLDSLTSQKMAVNTAPTVDTRVKNMKNTRIVIIYFVNCYWYDGVPMRFWAWVVALQLARYNMEAVDWVYTE